MNNQHKIISPRIIVQILFPVVLMPFLPMLISWHWYWWEAWVYAIICILGYAISRMLAARRHPDLIAERVRMMHHENDKPWDRFLIPLIGLGFGSLLLVAGLDALFGWSPPFIVPVKILSLVIILAGNVFGSYALLENRFFSFIVRIQTERGHQVVSSGPYRWIRHPGYAGALLVYLATPVFLDSRLAFIPAVFLFAVFVIRTALEDRFLQDELAGYGEYARRVRYRLLPGVW
ncbi:MAG: isoprenylcysteine carboxylmethyltransferase family protein [Deltaproteobacteria bacterium]|nr:isoprenylcysteine carboxylmethyltransferase family protein [Deltaproteobacteria bacterium]MBW2595490.1 isoprenylcysteine carboxylmethyltransferase family protein [Deltaproteobacteria bacterium]MBW2649474.1 isoprenylcysteine carboxylmethyltransferase family protein [Deltaproteobacteria bacterium]